MKRFIEFFKKLPQYAHQPWYPFALCLTAMLDYIVFVIPLDPIVVTSIAAARSRWLALSIWTTVGSTLGAVIFSLLIRYFGETYLHQWVPHLLEGEFVATMSHWLQNHGFWALMGIGALPINQHPAVAVASLAKVKVSHIAIAMFTGRILRYLIYTWLIGHANRGLTRFFKK